MICALLHSPRVGLFRFQLRNSVRQNSLYTNIHTPTRARNHSYLINFLSLNVPGEQLKVYQESNFRGKVPYQDIGKEGNWGVINIQFAQSENGDFIMTPQKGRKSCLMSRSQSDQTDWLSVDCVWPWPEKGGIFGQTNARSPLWNFISPPIIQFWRVYYLQHSVLGMGFIIIHTYWFRLPFLISH